MTVLLLGNSSVQAAVSVTTNPAAVSKTQNDTTYSAVGNVAFGSGNKGDWGSDTVPRSYELAAPANWEFLNSGVTATGAVLSGAPAYVANVDGNFTILRWSITTGVNSPGTNTVSGIQIRPIAGKAVAGTSGSMTLSGIVSPTSLAAGTFTVSAPAVALRFVQNVPATVQNGVAVTPAVTVEVINANNTRVTGLPNYSITLAGTGLTLSNATATTASGLATFTGLSIAGLSGAGKTLTASATGLTSATSSSFTLTTGTASKLAFTVQPTAVAVGSNFSPNVQVAVQDAAGNTVTTATNQISLAGTGVTLTGTSPVTPVNGVATFSALTVSGTAGSGKTLRATSTGLTLADSAAFVLNPGPAASLAFTQQPSNIQKFQNFSPPVRVAFLDSSGNLATGAAGTITLAPTAGQGVILNGTSQNVEAVNGEATFSSITVSGTSGSGKTLTASSTGLTTVTSTPYSIDAFSLSSPTTQWKTLLRGPAFDFINDQQATATDLELVGDQNHPVLYSQYDDGGTPGTLAENDDTVYFRVRLSGSKSTGSSAFSSGYLFLGCDVNLDGAIDFFISVTKRTTKESRVSIWSTGSGLNNSPSTTTIAGEVPLYGLLTEPGLSRFSFVPVTSVLDPSVADLNLNTPAAELSGLTLTQQDHFLSFAIPFSNTTPAIDSYKEAAAVKGFNVNKDTPLNILLATSTQSNSMNSDINGYQGGTKSAISFKDQGAFVPTRTFPNALPVITSDGGGDVGGVIYDGSNPVTTVTATDADGDALQYEISGGGDAGLFTLDLNTGVLNFTNPSFSTPGSYEVIVRAYDMDPAYGTRRGNFDQQQLFITIANPGDTTSPTVLSVTSAKANGQYKAGEIIPVSVTFSEAVQVTGTPTLTLATAGTANRVVNYASGTGSPVLVFNYTVQAGDTSPDLDYLSLSALALNGGVIKDANNNNAVLTLPTPGASGSLGANKALIIDTTSPVFNLAGSSASGSSVTLAFTDTNVLDDANLPLLSQFSVEVDPDGAGGSPYAPATVVGVTVQSAAKTATVVLANLIPQGVGATVRVSFTDPTVGVDDAITLQDRAGNDVASFGPSVITATPDTTKPRVLNIAAYAPDENGTPIYQNGHFAAGTVIPIKVEWSEPVVLNEGVQDPDPRVPIHIHLNNGDFAHYHAGSGTAVWTFEYTVQSSTVTPEGLNPNYEKALLDYDAVNSLMIHSDTVTDLAGNFPDLVGSGGGTGVSIVEPGQPTSLGANNEITIDTIKPAFVKEFLTDEAVGSRITISFSDTNPLDAANPPAAARFLVTYGVSNTVATITGVSVSSSARQVLINISDELTAATTNVRVSYTPQTSNDANAIQDLAGNDALPLSNEPVINLITEGPVAAPLLTSLVHDRQASPAIFTGDPIVYTFTFNRDIDLSTFAPFDLRNASATTPASFTIGSITEQGLTGTYVVTVIPTSPGLIDLRIAQGASILDHGGVALDTSGGDLGTGAGNPTITVSGRDQVITFPQPSSIVFGVSPGFALGATASSGLPVTYTLNFGPVTLLDGYVTPIGVGEVSITASQAGDQTTSPAQSVTRTFQVLILGSGTAPRMNIRSNGVSIRSGETKFLDRDNTDFGKYTFGESSPKTSVYTIENLGDRTLVLNNVAAPVTLTNLSGPAAFRVVQPAVTSVLGGDRLTATTVNFSIVYEPTTTGVTEAQISIQNSDANRSPYTFRIRGEAIASPAPTDLILVDNRVQHNVLSSAPSGTLAGLLSPVPVVGTDYVYSIVGGTDAALFNIPSGTNQLRLNIGETPDIVAKPKYFLRIRVTRGADIFEKDFEVIVMTVASREGDFVVNDRGPSDSGEDSSGIGQILLISKDATGASYVKQTYTTDIVDPYEIAVEADGDFIIANYEHLLNTLTLKDNGGIYRIDRINATTTKVTGNTGAVGEVVLRTPLGVEVEADGNLVVADADYSPAEGVYTGGVIRVNPTTGDKTLLTAGESLEYVQGIGLNPVSGEIYISNLRFPITRGGQIIRVNKTTGEQTIIAPTNGINLIRVPIGIACEADGQSIVVADAFAQRLIRIDLATGNQTYLTARPDTLDPLSSEPKLDFPTHVAIEADGNYIVTDGRDDGRPRRVIRIDKGTGVASLIVSDTGTSFFDQPRGVRLAK